MVVSLFDVWFPHPWQRNAANARSSIVFLIDFIILDLDCKSKRNFMKIFGGEIWLLRASDILLSAVQSGESY